MDLDHLVTAPDLRPEVDAGVFGRPARFRTQSSRFLKRLGVGGGDQRVRFGEFDRGLDLGRRVPAVGGRARDPVALIGLLESRLLKVLDPGLNRHVDSMVTKFDRGSFEDPGFGGRSMGLDQLVVRSEWDQVRDHAGVKGGGSSGASPNSSGSGRPYPFVEFIEPSSPVAGLEPS